MQRHTPRHLHHARVQRCIRLQQADAAHDGCGSAAEHERHAARQGPYGLQCVAQNADGEAQFGRLGHAALDQAAELFIIIICVHGTRPG